MTCRLAAVALLVADYGDAIAWFTSKLDFVLIADTPLGDGKRWVVVAPSGDRGAHLVLAKAVGEEQVAAIGSQAGGRVWLFLETGDFARDHATFIARGVEFLETARHEAYGTVAVFRDLYGNKWDLIEPAGKSQAA